jgi:hypothetical protein
MEPFQIARKIYDAATPILRVNGLGGSQWRRNDVKASARTGPWLSAKYDVLDRTTWMRKAVCIYFVCGQDGVIRYTGISRNGVKDRWREATAIDHLTGNKRTRKELHHSQCWRHIEKEYLNNPASVFEIRVISGIELANVLQYLGSPLSGFLALGTDYEGLVMAVERWMCNNQSSKLVTWNTSMTGLRSAG